MSKTIQELKSIPQEIDARIAHTLIKGQNDALTPVTIKAIEYSLRHLARHANLLDPEDVKHYVSIADTNKNKTPVAADTKNRWLYAYDKFCQYNNIQWKKPYYKAEEKTPLIPTRDNVNAIINNSSKRYITIFTLLSEVGMSPAELSNVTQSDIDKEQGIIRIRGTKGHASASYKLKPQPAIMLRAYLAENKEEHPFPHPKAISQVWIDTRHRTAKKLNKPELEQIQCRNLRNYSGAQYYLNMPVRDPIAVMRHLRHKKLETTMHYLRAIILDEDPQYASAIATNVKEAQDLVNNGYEYVTGEYNDGGKIFRKRK
jgi:integrase